MKLLGLFSACLLTASPLLAQASRTVAADQPINIRLEPGQPTAIILPEPIAGMGVVIDPARLSIDHDGPYIILQALDPAAAGRFFAIGASGKLYKVTYKVQAPGDDAVYVTAEKPQERGGVAQAKPVSASTMLRALRYGTPLPGQDTADIAPPALNDERVLVQSWQAVRVGTIIGMAMGIQNATAEPLGVDVRYGVGGSERYPNIVRVAQWGMPPHHTVRAVAADKEIMDAGDGMRVYLVLERR